MGVLEARGLGFRFAGAEGPTLTDVSLTLRPGEVCALIGGNGSGKSTLFRLLAGLFVPEHGRVRVEGLTVGSEADEPTVRRLLQVVTHDPDYALIGETVQADVEFGLANLGYQGRERTERREWALEALGLGGMAARAVDSLSGGERQLVRLAGALAVEPRYLLLDEALSMVDEVARESALDLLRKQVDGRKLAVLMATHDLADLRWADRVVWLEGGQVALDGPVEEALETLVTESGAGSAFALPAVAAVAAGLQQGGWSVPLTLDVERLADAVCAWN